MCLGEMSLPNVGSAIPSKSELFPTDVPASQAQPGVRDRDVSPILKQRSPTVPSVPTSEAAPGASKVGASGDGRSSGSGINSVLIPGEGAGNEELGGRNGEERNETGSTGGDGGDDDFDNSLVDDEGDPTDDTSDEITKRDEEEGPTTSPARIVSPLIRAVQGDRQINRRGRNSLFIPQVNKHGERRVDDSIVNSASRAPGPVTPSPVEFGLIPLRR